MDPSSMGDMMNQWDIQSYQRDQGAKNIKKTNVFGVGWFECPNFNGEIQKEIQTVVFVAVRSQFWRKSRCNHINSP